MFPDDAEDKEKTHGITRMDETNIVWQPQILASQTKAETMQRKDNDIFRMNYFPGANITFIFTYMCVCVYTRDGQTHTIASSSFRVLLSNMQTHILCVCVLLSQIFRLSHVIETSASAHPWFIHIHVSISELWYYAGFDKL